MPDLAALSYAVRGRDVVIAERLTIGPDDQLTLLQVLLKAIHDGGGPGADRGRAGDLRDGARRHTGVIAWRR